MPKKKPNATGMPTAALPITSSGGHGQSAEPGSTNPPSAPRRDSFGNPMQRDSASHQQPPGNMGLTQPSAGPGQIARLDQELLQQINTFMRVCYRNEEARQRQITQLSSILSQQTEAHDQAFRDLQATYRRADAARDWEMMTMNSMFVKRQEMFAKKED